MRCLAALLVLFSTAPLTAQGTGEAIVTIRDQTLFLSADNRNSAVPMVVCGADHLSLTFAQLHLRFPMPPFLRITLRDASEEWSVDTLRLDQTGDAIDAFVTPSDARISDMTVAEDGTIAAVLSGQAMVAGSPLGSELVTVHVEFTMTCPPE